MQVGGPASTFRRVSSTVYGSRATSRGRTAGLLPAAAVLLAGALALVGALLDLLTGPGLGLVFDVLFVLGCAAAAALVKRDGLRAVVVAPPLLFAVMALGSGLVQTDSAPRTPMRQTLALFTELVVGAPTLVTGTVVAAVIALVRRAPRR